MQARRRRCLLADAQVQDEATRPRDGPSSRDRFLAPIKSVLMVGETPAQPFHDLCPCLLSWCTAEQPRRGNQHVAGTLAVAAPTHAAEKESKADALAEVSFALNPLEVIASTSGAHPPSSTAHRQRPSRPHRAERLGGCPPVEKRRYDAITPRGILRAQAPLLAVPVRRFLRRSASQPYSPPEPELFEFSRGSDGAVRGNDRRSPIGIAYGQDRRGARASSIP